jgi:DnaJ-class molecular chaperone
MHSYDAGETNYYEVLGIVPSANAADIDAAYRGLVRRFHPDMGRATPESLTRMKLINEAYSVLSDSQKRRRYDQQWRPSRISVPVHAEPSAGPTVSAGLPLELPIAPEEAAHGGPCQFTLTTWAACGHCHGTGRVGKACCGGCDGCGKIRHQRNMCVRIPRSVRSGTVLRIVSDGSPLWGAGDLLLKIVIRPCW